MSDLIIFMCFMLGLSVATIVGLIVVVVDQDKRIKENKNAIRENENAINWIERSIDRVTGGMDKLSERINELEGAKIVDELKPLI